MTRPLIFSIVETRPDIVFATLVVSRFAKNPLRHHIEVVKIIRRYLKATNTVRTSCSGNEKGDITIKGYSNSDCAGDHVSKKSNSGFIFILNEGPVSWNLKKQATVALSSIEAENMALTLVAKGPPR